MCANHVLSTQGFQNTGPVIVVNDDPVQLLTLASFLKKGGFETICSAGPEEALKVMDPANLPSLIVTDIYMPGIDGWRFCRLLRSEEYREFNRIPILVVSATFSGDAPERISADIGADAFLPCPVDGRAFLDTVSALIEGRTVCRLPGVLIVEDDAVFSGLLVRCFQNSGYRVMTAATVQEAEVCLAREALELAVIDYELAGSHGDVLLNALCRSHPGCAIIMMSGHADADLYLDWIKSGATACLHKPFPVDYLLEVCAKARREQALLRVERLLEKRTHELQAREKQYRTLVAGLPDVVMRCDSQFRQLFVSDNFEQYFGVPAISLTGKVFHETGLPMSFCEQLEVSVGRVFETGEASEAELVYEASGRRTIFNWRFQPEFHHSDLLPSNAVALKRRESVVSVLSFARDITEVKLAEEEQDRLRNQLSQSRKMETIGRLAGGVAHDFNNMLTVISGNAELVMEMMEEDDPLAENLREIRDAALRSANITRQLLAFSRKQSCVPQVLDINAAVEGVLPLLRRLIGAQAALSWKPADDVWNVLMDPSQFDQILVNLCVNARDAIGETSGNICVTVQNESIAPSFCVGRSGLVAGDYVKLSVRDNGCGMKEEVLEQIFEPFFSTKAAGSGTGLGLATVYGIVTQNKGGIDVSSTPGEGTVFNVYLKQTKESLPMIGDRLLFGSKPFTSKVTALIVEDEVSILKLCRRLLEKNGFDVLTAAHPSDGLRLAREHSGIIDLLLSDLSMPEMNGRTLAREILRIFPSIKCVFISGHSADDLKGPDEDLSSCVFLQKPFSGKELVSKIEQLLNPSVADVQAPLLTAFSDSVTSSATSFSNAPLPVGESDRMSRQLEQIQKIESVGRLVRSVFHENNNLMMAIQWYAEKAMDLVAPGHPGYEWLSRILDAIHKSSEVGREMLFRRILEFSCSKTAVPVKLNLDETIAGAMTFLRHLAGTDVPVDWQPGAESADVWIDPAQLDQVLANLCLNAAEAICGSGGSVKFQTVCVFLDKAFCSALSSICSGSYVRLSISDEGCGMDSKVQARVFEPFFSTKDGSYGAGLGLPIVRGIIRHSRGEVLVRSQPGEGTVVDVYLPIFEVPEGS